MIKFRPHREYLSEAMEEYREFDTVQEMCDYVKNKLEATWESNKVYKVYVDSHDFGEDDRIGWKHYHHVKAVIFERDHVNEGLQCWMQGTCDIPEGMPCGGIDYEQCK